jgi:hypothetical protein
VSAEAEKHTCDDTGTFDEASVVVVVAKERLARIYSIALAFLLYSQLGLAAPPALPCDSSQ